MAVAKRLLLGLILAVPTCAAVAQTYDFEVEAANAGTVACHERQASLEVHPAVALPGETVVLRLTVGAPGYRAPQPGAYASASIRITDEAGEVVLSRDDGLGPDGCNPGACEGLAEWSFVWNPGRLAPGLYRAWAAADDTAGAAWPAVREFALRDPAAEGPGHRPDPDPPEMSPGLAAGDTLGIPPPLVCRVEANPLRVHPGESVEIALTVTNPTLEPARRFFPDNCALGYALLDHDDRLVASAARTSEDLDAWLDIPPGESLRRVWTWTWDPAEVTPGRCYLRGGLGALGERESAPWVDLVLWRPSAFAFRLD